MVVELDPTLIVEDDPATQQRFARLLAEAAGSPVQAGFAGDIADAMAQLASDVPSLALVDIGLPDGDGIELIGWLHVHHPQTTSVVISAWGGDDAVLAALQAGATGYLLKEREDIELVLALQSIQRGGAPIDPFVARHILGLLAATPAPAPPAFAPCNGHGLSEREVEILGLVARGFSNREIAEQTTLSRFTIEDYTKSIYRKLAVRSRTAAVFAAKAQGWLP